MERLILRSAAVCTRRPWWVVAIWIVLLAAALPFSGKAQGVLSSGGFDVPGSQSQQAIDYLNNQPGRGAYSFSFLWARRKAVAAVDFPMPIPPVRPRIFIATADRRS